MLTLNIKTAAFYGKIENIEKIINFQFELLMIILKCCAHVMLELYLLVIVGSQGGGKGISYSLGILHHNRVGGDFIKLSACHSSLNIEIGKVERLINFMDILCLSVYFEDGRNLKLYLLCRVSSINSLVSMPRPAIHTTGNMIDLNK